MVKRHSDPDKLQEHLISWQSVLPVMIRLKRSAHYLRNGHLNLLRLKAAQSVARATASFFRPLSNFSQYIKDRYEFGPRISAVLWRAKSAMQKNLKSTIPHVNSILEESKKDTDTRTHARPTVRYLLLFDRDIN